MSMNKILDRNTVPANYLIIHLKPFYRGRRDSKHEWSGIFACGKKEEEKSSLEHGILTINIPRESHYAASTLIRVLFANLSTPRREGKILKVDPWKEQHFSSAPAKDGVERRWRRWKNS